MSDEYKYIKPPRCDVCGENHEPEYPHELTDDFCDWYRDNRHRRANIKDLYSHCKGIIYEAASRSIMRHVLSKANSETFSVNRYPA